MGLRHSLHAHRGVMDVHPRSGMALLNSDKRDEYLEFYDKLTHEAEI